ADPAAKGQIERLAYTARALGDRPQVATLYVPAHLDRLLRPDAPLPVVVFLHGIPGAPEDWLAGGGLARLLDEEIAAGRFPAALALVPENATLHDPRAGWVDAPHQPVLQSLRTDLLAAVARRFPAADGALRLAGADGRFGYAVAIGPRIAPPRLRRAADVIVVGTAPPDGLPVRHRWVRWRADLRGALRALAGAGFGRPPS